MQCKPILTCLVLLLSPALFAQSSQQPTTDAQVQSETKAARDLQKDDAQKDSDKKDGSDRDHKVHVRLGGVSVSGGYISNPFFFSPFWPYGFYPYGFYPYDFAYSPFFYGPFYSPFYWPYAGSFAYAPDKGQVKLKVNLKNADVFLDGAYAGTADHVKDMWLDSGAYNLSVSAPGREPFQQRIYILSGKTLKIEAKLVPQKEESQTEVKP